MKLDFCAACGSNEDLQQHHILPVIFSNIERSETDEKDTITLCNHHHKMIHGVKTNNHDKHNTMVKEGIKKAREKGVTLGRPSTLTNEKLEKVKTLIEQGYGVRQICRLLQIGPATYYKAVEKISEIEEEKTEDDSRMIRVLEKFSNP